MKIMSSPVPLDLLDLMDFGSSGGIGSGQGVHPEFFSRCLFAEASRQLAGLRRMNNALGKKKCPWKARARYWGMNQEAKSEKFWSGKYEFETRFG